MMGRVSSEQMERELGRTNAQPKAVEIVQQPTKGRKEGDVNVPDGLRKIIAETHLMEGRGAAVDLAKRFGISSSSVSAYANGATSTTTYHQPDPPLKNHIVKSKERAIRKASKNLNAALGAITQEKLDYADPKDLAGIAKDMSVIIRNLEPPAPVSEKASANQQFVIFAPSFRKEESFETITVNE